MKKLLKNHPAFIARGGAAAVLLVVLTVAMFFDLISGNTESVGPWLMVIGISVVLTLISATWGNK